MWVEGTRGGVIETRHAVHAAVVDVQGALVWSSGDPELLTFWRSGAKPFQALPLILDGAADRYGITPEELAIACASHSAEPRQLALVRDLLGRAGLSERDLMCGPHPSLSDAVARDYAKRNVRVTALHSNCSGNHAAMLVLARHHGWSTEFYIRADHPVQTRCLAEVSRWSGVPAGGIATGVDGCGVVCFGLPLRNMAWAYARLGAENRVGRAGGEGTPGAAVLLEAMIRHPELLAGEGRACTEMMRAHPGRVVAKAGAAGVYCGLVTAEGLGIAVKIEDGNGQAAALAMAAVLLTLGLRPQPQALLSQPILNTRGERVGELRAAGALEVR